MLSCLGTRPGDNMASGRLTRLKDRVYNLHITIQIASHISIFLCLDLGFLAI